MADPKDTELAEKVALFRYGLIAPMVQKALPRGELRKYLEQVALQLYVIPGSNRTQVAEATARDWLRNYKGGGFDALKPRARKDQGIARSLAVEVTDVLAKLKTENPTWSVRVCIREARQRNLIEESIPLPPSTVHRHLQARGLMDKAPTAPVVDRRRFAHEAANEMWMSDVMHGPHLHGHKTYLICFLDDATRIIPHAEFCLSENAAAFMPVLKQALRRRGLPQRLFVDNGANYRCHQLSVACARLGVSLIHAKPYSPQSKGKQERFFRTLRAAFLGTLKINDVKDLEDLNARLWAYVEGEYHHMHHGGLTDESPLEAWARTATHVRFPDPRVDLDEMLLMEAQRRVNQDRTISLNGKLFEVDASLMGKKVTLRFDPSKPHSPIHVYDDKVRVGDARPLDIHLNATLPRDNKSLRFSGKE